MAKLNGKKIIEQRACVGCRKVQYKREMIRLVRTPKGEINVDFSYKVSGHGAYICKNSQCLKVALKKRQFERALNCKVPSAIYEQLNEIISMSEQN